MKRQIIIGIITALLLPLTLLAASGAVEVVQSNDISINIEQLSERKFQVDFNTYGSIISVLGYNEELPAVTRWIALSPSGNVTAKCLNMQTAEIPSDLSEFIRYVNDNEIQETNSTLYQSTIDNYQSVLSG